MGYVSDAFEPLVVWRVDSCSVTEMSQGSEYCTNGSAPSVSALHSGAHREHIVDMVGLHSSVMTGDHRGVQSEAGDCIGHCIQACTGLFCRVRKLRHPLPPSPCSVRWQWLRVPPQMLTPAGGPSTAFLFIILRAKRSLTSDPWFYEDNLSNLTRLLFVYKETLHCSMS